MHICKIGYNKIVGILIEHRADINKTIKGQNTFNDCLITADIILKYYNDILLILVLDKKIFYE